MNKNILFTVLIVGITIGNAQQLYFPKDSCKDDQLLTKVIKESALGILDQYQNKNNKKYYTDLINLQILAEKYQEALQSIDSLRTFSEKDYPDEVSLIKAPEELYCKANFKKTNFDAAYQKAFDELYTPLTEKTKLRFPFNFDIDPDEKARKLCKILATQENDSISHKDFLTIVSQYVSKEIALKTKSLVFSLLKKEDDKRYHIQDSVAITTKDGATIAMKIARKKGNETPMPAVLNFSIYPYRSGVRDDATIKESVYYGYVGVFANTRGKRFSPQHIEPFEHDAKDVYEVIDWISKQPWSNGEVVMMGGSYLGFTQWAATKKLHPALKTIVPQVSVGVGNDYPMENNVFMSYMLRWINFVTTHEFIDLENFLDTKSWNKVYREWYRSGRSFRSLDSIYGKPSRIFQRWLDHPGYDSYWKNMTASEKDFDKINIPVLSTTGYFDSDQVGAMHYFREHTTRNKNAEHYLVIGPYNHSSAAGRTARKVGNYELDSVAFMDMDVLAYKWFDHIVKGTKKPDILKDKVNYQVMETNTWKHKPDLHSMNTDTLVFYLSNVRKENDYLLTKAYPESDEYIRQEVDLTYRGDSIQKSNKFYSKELQLHNQLSFISEPFQNPFDINGSFLADLYVTINKKDMDVLIELFEMKSDGSYIKLSDYLGRASYAKDPGTRNLLIPGKKELISTKNSIFISKRIQKGSRLVVLLGVNKNPKWQINYGTGKNVSDETIKDGEIPLRIQWFSDSAIKIPLSNE